MHVKPEDGREGEEFGGVGGGMDWGGDNRGGRICSIYKLSLILSLSRGEII